jgi:hypothetical protein
MLNSAALTPLKGGLKTEVLHTDEKSYISFE